MGDVSKHFSRFEFDCVCGCGFDSVDVGLLNWLEKIRTHFGSPVIITSGCRCLNHNRTIKNSKDTSQHIKAKAIDFHIPGIDLEIIYDYVDTMIDGTGGLGIYDTFIHLDNRKKNIRWDFRITKRPEGTGDI